jgi:hypothetical protein
MFQLNSEICKAIPPGRGKKLKIKARVATVEIQLVMVEIKS